MGPTEATWDRGPRRRWWLVAVGAGAIAVALPTTVGSLVALVAPGPAGIVPRLLNALLFAPAGAAIVTGGVLTVRAGLDRTGRAPVAPSSRSGRIALWSLGTAVVAVAALVGWTSLFAEPAETLTPASATPLAIAWLAGVATLGTAGTAVTVGRDRTPLVVVALGVGWTITVLGIGEVLFPH